jgi:hypothetical protein
MICHRTFLSSIGLRHSRALQRWTRPVRWSRWMQKLPTYAPFTPIDLVGLCEGCGAVGLSCDIVGRQFDQLRRCRLCRWVLCLWIWCIN